MAPEAGVRKFSLSEISNAENRQPLDSARPAQSRLREVCEHTLSGCKLNLESNAPTAEGGADDAQSGYYFVTILLK